MAPLSLIHAANGSNLFVQVETINDAKTARTITPIIIAQKIITPFFISALYHTMPLMKIIMDRLYTNLFKPEFRLPLVVFGLLLLGFIPDLDIAWLAGAALGITKIFVDSFEKIRERNFSLDYIALLAMIVALVAD